MIDLLLSCSAILMCVGSLNFLKRFEEDPKGGIFLKKYL
nr:MAG TPA: hypothetical protein [Caudoviricetes sp.]